jgi:CRISPR-associated protein Csd1
MILQALNGAYDRFAKVTLANGKPRVPSYGFSYERIGYALVISSDGKLIDVTIVDADLDVPKDPTTTRTSGISSMFLWDKTAYVLGLAPEQKKRTADEHAAFKALQREIIGTTSDEGLIAVLAFLSNWEPDRPRIEGFGKDIIGANVAFRLDGVPGFVHERQVARELWVQHLARQDAPNGSCLVTSEHGRIAMTHPTLGGVRGAQSSGASIVSFNQESFKSYGKDQGANAPVSERAAFAYTTVLNDLLSKDSKQKVQIGDATTVFWAESDDATVANQAEQAFAWLLAPSSPADADARETTLLKTHMDAFAKGRPLPNTELKLDPATRFYILGLSPNAARLSVRFWEMTTLGGLGQAFYQHWQDLRIDTPPARGTPPSIPALTLRTAPARRDRQDNIKFSFDDVSPLLSGELMRAVLTGTRYPGALLSNLVMRVRTDGVLDRIRVSLIKATIVRAMRLEQRLPKEDYLVRTDPNDPNTARRLGRLFAVLERAQLAALGDNINTTIKDKFLGAAAATPGQVFVGLIKNAQHHTKRLRNGHADAGWIKDSNHARRVGFGLERDIGSLWGSFNEGLPPQQSIEEQGLFFVGYYQERFAGKPDQQVGEEPGIDTPDINDDQE